MQKKYYQSDQLVEFLLFYCFLESLIIMDEQQIVLVSTCREGVGGHN